MEFFAYALIIFGIIFILLGLLNYFKISHELNIVYKSIQIASHKNIGPFIFIILILFLILYLFYLAYIVFVQTEYNYFIMFTSLLLFLGGSFVYIILFLFEKIVSSLGNSHLEMIRSFVRFVAIRDKYTSRHSVHVADLVKILWEHLPLKLKNKTSKKDLIQAALLHDIGKIMIPLKLLNKKGSLSPKEYKKIKKHAANSVILLKDFQGFQKMIPWIKNHHERIDGKGYNRLKEHEIPLESKIIAVADTYSALTTNRVYQKKVSHEKAIIILQEASGTQLDKEIVDSFINISKESFDKIEFKLDFDFKKII